MKFKLILFFLLFCLGCTPTAAHRLNPEDAWERINRGALVVDARSEEEFNAGHIEGALNIPHDEVNDRIAEFGTDKNREIVTYCRSGRRAGVAADALLDNGFKKVFNAGGYSELARSRTQG